MVRRPKIAIIYYSATGNVASLAHNLSEGAESLGAETKVLRVHETAPADAIASNAAWQKFVDTASDEFASLTDLEWADGIALG